MNIYEECRRYVIDYFNAPLNKYTAIFIGNTTEGINKLSNILIENKNDIVITSRMEHHSNDLPWRGKCDLKYVEVDEKGRIIMEELEEMFSIYQDRIKYVTITGASNVTGYITDIRRVAKLAHKYGAKLIVDGAQLVPHRAINICGKEDDDYIDFLIFSAHKVYAPFGSGAIIGLRDELEKYPPDTKGGGTVERVLDDEIIWLSTPEKNEAGSPNFFGAVALMQALKEMNKIGFELIESNEKKLLNILIADDEKLIRNVLKEYLLVENYHVFEANDGKEVLDIIRNNCIDLILLDIMMPNMDGFSALKEIKKENNIPVIVLSARLCLLLSRSNE